MGGGGSPGVTTIPHENDSDLALDDGDAIPDPDGDERWPRHAMDFFAEVKNDITTAIKQTRVKEGDEFVVKFKGKMPLKYCGIIAPSEDPLLWFGTKAAIPMEKFCFPNALIWFLERTSDK